MNCRIWMVLILAFLPALSPVNAEEYVTPKNWEIELHINPVGDYASDDVVNLVPKQSVMLNFKIWYPTTSTWLTKYPDWIMPGVNVEQYQTAQRNINRNDAKTELKQYGQQQNFILTPNDTGRLKLVNQYIDVSPKQDDSERVFFNDDIVFNVRLPDGFYSVESFLPAYQLEVSQMLYKYSLDESSQPISIDNISALKLKKGEMLERRVTVFAKGLKGEFIPTLIPAEGALENQVERAYEDVVGILGFEGGKRVESRYYSPAEGGEINAEEINLEWYDITSQTKHTVVLPGFSFDTEKVVSYESSIAPSWIEKNVHAAITYFALCTVLIGSLIIILKLNTSLISRVAKKIKGLYLSGKTSEWFLFSRYVFFVLFNEKKIITSLLQWNTKVNVKLGHFSNMDFFIAQEVLNYYYTANLSLNIDETKIVGKWYLVVEPAKLRFAHIVKERNNPYRLPEL
ncbi:hypothetical protein ACJO1Y_23165 [Vibrio parahaemolyticus]|uniref:hypothetical protein n=1 Tax=Vibrio parahaemolyticus TaxID=670 RepID=UPI0023619DAA|nr:hypothetical protein [Vibrio parahaemolyticus]